MTTTLSSSQSVEGQTLRIGIVGAGGRGINCFGKLLVERDNAQLVALADTNLERMKGAAERLESEMNFYPSAAAMYEGEQLDGAVITVPDYLHADYVVEALQSGVPHVLIDKPLAITSEGCLRVIQTMQKTSGQVAMGFNLRHRAKPAASNGAG